MVLLFHHGGERAVYGQILAQTQLLAKHIDTGEDLWTGEVPLGRRLSALSSLMHQGAGYDLHQPVRRRAGACLSRCQMIAQRLGPRLQDNSA